MSVPDPKRTSAPKTPTCYMCCLVAEPIRQNDPQTSMVRSGKDGVVKSALNRRAFKLFRFHELSTPLLHEPSL